MVTKRVFLVEKSGWKCAYVTVEAALKKAKAFSIAPYIYNHNTGRPIKADRRNVMLMITEQQGATFIDGTSGKFGASIEALMLEGEL